MSDDYRIGVTGSRNWVKEGYLRRALQYTAQEAQLAGRRPVMVNGGCPTGADWIANKIWRSWKWEPEIHPADWDNCGPECPSTVHRKKRWPDDKHHPGTSDTWCPKAGPRRNLYMVSLGMEVLLAFPSDGPTRSGTWSCIHRARQAGVRVVLPDRWD